MHDEIRLKFLDLGVTPVRWLRAFRHRGSLISKGAIMR